MKEIVVVSGKGGTGKTSITASFAVLAKGKAVLADCDVDAADLHLVMRPEVRKVSEFRSGFKAQIRMDDCTGCGKCYSLCRFDAINKNGSEEKQVFRIDPAACEGCGVCFRFCPAGAVDFEEEKCGEWFISESRTGPMVHARLGVAAENSGRLVTLVRNQARRIAEEKNTDMILIDGSPGIGCPVIASLTGTDLAVIVTEPTVSGLHDIERIAELTKKLHVPAVVCVNRWDINPETAEKIRETSSDHKLFFGGNVCYDTSVTRAQRQQLSVVEYTEGGVAEDVKKLWNTVMEHARLQ